jgi:hypothetical protein
MSAVRNGLPPRASSRASGGGGVPAALLDRVPESRRSYRRRPQPGGPAGRAVRGLPARHYRRGDHRRGRTAQHHRPSPRSTRGTSTPSGRGTSRRSPWSRSRRDERQYSSEVQQQPHPSMLLPAPQPRSLLAFAAQRRSCAKFAPKCRKTDLATRGADSPGSACWARWGVAPSRPGLGRITPVDDPAMPAAGLHHGGELDIAPLLARRWRESPPAEGTKAVNNCRAGVDLTPRGG